MHSHHFYVVILFDNNLCIYKILLSMNQLKFIIINFFFTDVNDCDNQPCKNKGVCRDLDGDYTCQCPSPYVGKQCQLSKHNTDQILNIYIHVQSNKKKSILFFFYKLKIIYYYTIIIIITISSSSSSSQTSQHHKHTFILYITVQMWS